MARISNVQQVEARPITPGYQDAGYASPSAFGGGLARGLEVFGQDVVSGSNAGGDAYLMQLAQDQERVAKTADNAWVSSKINYLHGDNGIYTKEGESAISAQKDALTYLQKSKNDIASGITDPKAKEMFNLSADARINAETQNIDDHVAQQRKVANSAASEARITGAVNDAAVGWSDPKTLARSQAVVDGEVQSLAEINGWSDEVIKDKRGKATTAIYQQAIVSAIKAGKPEQGRQIFNTYRSQIDGPNASNIEEELRKQTNLGEAQKAADAIIKKGGSFESQLSTARAIGDPELRKTTEAEVASRISETGTLYSLHRLLGSEGRTQAEQNSADGILAMGLTQEQSMERAGQLTGELRDKVEERIMQHYSRQAAAYNIEQTLNKPKLEERINAASDMISSLGLGQTDALARARAIPDWQVRDGVVTDLNRRYSERAGIYSTDKMLSENERLKKTQDMADQIVAQLPDRKDAFDYANSLDDPVLKKDVSQELDKRFNEQSNAEAINLKDISKDAFEKIYNGTPIDQYAKDNPKEFQTIQQNPNVFESLKKAEILTAEGKLYATHSDGITMAKIMAMSTADIQKLDVTSMRHFLTEHEYSKAVTLQHAAKEAVDKANTNYAAYTRADTLLTRMAPRELNWGDKKQTEQQRDIQNDITNQLHQFVGEYTSQGVKPDNNLIEAEARRLVTKVNTGPRSTFLRVLSLGMLNKNSNETYAAEINRMQPSQKAQLRVDLTDIPSENIDNAKQIFAKYGHPSPTDDELEQYFGAYLAGDNTRMRNIIKPTASEIPRKVEPTISGGENRNGNKGGSGNDELRSMTAGEFFTPIPKKGVENKKTVRPMNADELIAPSAGKKSTKNPPRTLDKNRL